MRTARRRWPGTGRRARLPRRGPTVQGARSPTCGRSRGRPPGPRPRRLPPARSSLRPGELGHVRRRHPEGRLDVGLHVPIDRLAAVVQGVPSRSQPVSMSSRSIIDGNMSTVDAGSSSTRPPARPGALTNSGMRKKLVGVGRPSTRVKPGAIMSMTVVARSPPPTTRPTPRWPRGGPSSRPPGRRRPRAASPGAGRPRGTGSYAGSPGGACLQRVDRDLVGALDDRKRAFAPGREPVRMVGELDVDEVERGLRAEVTRSGCGTPPLGPSPRSRPPDLLKYLPMGPGGAVGGGDTLPRRPRRRRMASPKSPQPVRSAAAHRAGQVAAPDAGRPSDASSRGRAQRPRGLGLPHASSGHRSVNSS